MTVREALGLVAINLFYAAVGLMLLWSFGAWRSWGDLGRVAGIAYFLGIAALVIALTAELVVGVDFGVATLVVTGGAIAACALAAGRWSGRTAVSGVGSVRMPRLSVGSALWTGGLIVYFEMLFRASQLAPVGEWDAWWVWTIRAKALYYFGDLGGADLVNGDASDYPSYPPGLSLVHAAAFVAMGQADAVSLHLQHWFLVLGFVVATVGLLKPRVSSIVLVPFVVIAVSTPLFIDWSTFLAADLLLAFQVALSAILTYQWLEGREAWRLGCVTVLLGGALLTKREAVLVVACVLLAGLAVSYRQRTWAWPRLVVAGLVAVAFAVPWWIGAFGGAGPSEGFLGVFGHPERILPSFGLITGVFIDQDLALGAGVLTSVIVLIAFGAGARMSAAFLAVFLGAGLITTTILFASEPLFAFSRLPDESPVQRLVLVLLTSSMPLTALALSDSVGKARATLRLSSASAMNDSAWRVLAPWALVGVFALVYPLMLALG